MAAQLSRSAPTSTPVGARALSVVRRVRQGALWRVLLGGLLLTGALRHQPAPAAEVDEVNLQAAFTLNFAKFTVWPAHRLADAGGRFLLCQLGGSDRLAAALQALQGRTVQGLPVVFQRLESGLEAARCLLVFVGGGSDAPAFAAGAAVLTVGEEPGFTDHGGMIGFMRSGARLRFQVNLGAVRRAGLALSSQVLSLAASVADDAARASGRP